ncbi:TlpA disulfide reductase family protein [candidate division KSB1 bacterium]
MSEVTIKTSKISLFLIIPGLLLFFACGQAGDGQSGADMQNSSAQMTAPSNALNFTLNDIHGQPFDLNTLKGKVLIIDFWDTWCPPCKKGIPEFIELKERYGEEDFEIVGIAFGRDGVGAVRDFAEEYKMNYPVLVADSREILTKLFEVYGYIEAIPTAFIIDKNGSIKQRFVGYNPISVFEGQIKPLM